ncbi:tRNA (5-methylaminomethyl-2-thiouridine)(34)-methyltransferase MnmD [Myroides sp. 1354]|uniref:tRNA (5-methylaminomethyl-2-thiouridine)(34)-methyltransferase MnmD n=1 Tax=unclassified Myroides TaxID=2642485 RepID=UPI0025762806|nr:MULTISPECIES: tRNA (5-methylaminomethyl-2-thiouridine)(34)-methyltransferase MnmD [unclassified Myroides]MDM1044991.1 tRNA (5-methylaminomethyl-2-thiouridine)(34)-methyltransferase MnmD [Myroides sp. R163-1]MDM1055873.1 tRNA (5-methylaminomethyl-2-thiouridine)(34)-methyltransferase MnmD [Myroides sp. 1354]MDM1069178.1 tRNA (5-methylaminomethyl-2-thiouridine)(34)-methyltransferase MnmD [Myroides sp. 1372]
MKRKIIVTSDGSHSLEVEEWGETYHSIHGAIQESNHVYIEQGLMKFMNQEEIKIVEFGLGTGLNAFLTMAATIPNHKKIVYHSIEAFPLIQEEYELLTFPTLLSEFKEGEELFKALHQAPWNEDVLLHPQIQLHKLKATFETVELQGNDFDLVYFDVFGYQFQPHLWSEAIFKTAYNSLRQGGVLVTYACRNPIKRNMKAAGFTIEIVPGPPGKREMLLAYKSE